MKIILENGKWVVKAEWLGAIRTVYSGNVWACCHFVAANK